jgi:hypothetical protein
MRRIWFVLQAFRISEEFSSLDCNDGRSSQASWDGLDDDLDDAVSISFWTGRRSDVRARYRQDAVDLCNPYFSIPSVNCDVSRSARVKKPSLAQTAFRHPLFVPLGGSHHFGGCHYRGGWGGGPAVLCEVAGAGLRRGHLVRKMSPFDRFILS